MLGICQGAGIFIYIIDIIPVKTQFFQKIFRPAVRYQVVRGMGIGVKDHLCPYSLCKAEYMFIGLAVALPCSDLKADPFLLCQPHISLFDVTGAPCFISI